MSKEKMAVFNCMWTHKGQKSFVSVKKSFHHSWPMKSVTELAKANEGYNVI